MSFTFRSFAPRSFTLPVRLRWLALGWIGAEMLVFLLLVKAVGLGATLLLGLGTTALGVVLLRRAGLDALRLARRGVAGAPPADGLSDGLLSGLGAVLLILPGFLLNAAGLVLAAPSSRRMLVARFGPSGAVARPRGRTDVLDLEPTEWRPLDRS